ncbi:MAG: arsenic efflux protein [Clostridia bacterium]|nr:arsenic efflux protein [Clostridia bacterium]
MHEFLHDVLLHSIIEFAKLLPFLFLAYLFMEFLEHKEGGRMARIVARSGRVGPLFGGLLGVLPQCSFSATASGLYAGRVISLGTLTAVYLATSDEMLPVLLASAASPLLILKLLGYKLVLGLLCGFAIDLILHLTKKKESHPHIHEMCEAEGCGCEGGVLRSAWHHTWKIGLFLLVMLLLLNTAIFFIGEETIARVFSSLPGVGHMLAALVGLIPNCASSVLLTRLYLEGVLSAGCMMSGLLAGSGLGLLILFRVNKNKKECLFILLLLFMIGSFFGLLTDLTPIGRFLA